MTPEELRKKADEASKPEYDSVMRALEASAAQGNHSLRLNELSAGAEDRLKAEGFSVIRFPVTHEVKITF